MSNTVQGMSDRLRAYRSRNEWGGEVQHEICGEAADRIDALEDVLEEMLFWVEGWLLPKNMGYWDQNQYEAAKHGAERARGVFADQGTPRPTTSINS